MGLLNGLLGMRFLCGLIRMRLMCAPWNATLLWAPQNMALACAPRNATLVWAPWKETLVWALRMRLVLVLFQNHLCVFHLGLVPFQKLLSVILACKQNHSNSYI